MSQRKISERLVGSQQTMRRVLNTEYLNIIDIDHESTRFLSALILYLHSEIMQLQSLENTTSSTNSRQPQLALVRESKVKKPSLFKTKNHQEQQRHHQPKIEKSHKHVHKHKNTGSRSKRY